MFSKTPERPLFTGAAPLEAEMRVSKRPLGELSNFVAQEMPGVLTQVKSGEVSVGELASKADELVHSMSEDEFQARIRVRKAGLGGYYRYNPDVDIASLDLKMLEAAIVHNGGEAPESLICRVDEISEITDQPPVMTYEEVIIGGGYGNPQSDPRVFTEEANFHFLQGHSVIDSRIRLATGHVVLAQAKLREHGREEVDRAAQDIYQGAEILTRAVRDMDAYREKLSPEDFIGFRKYYGEHEPRGLKGPSGAFTDTVPIFDLLFAGELMPAEQRQYLVENSTYFPRNGRQEMKHAAVIADKGNSLVGLYMELGRPRELAMSMLAINRAMRSFRGRHGNVVEKQLEDVLGDPEAKGTAGESIRTFLEARRESTREIGRQIRGEDV